MAEYWKNGKKYIIPDLTPEELAEVEARRQAAEREYWTTVPYDTAVVNEIRKDYDINAELAIQRQKEEKPEEHAKYYARCENAKVYVKQNFAKYGREI